MSKSELNALLIRLGVTFVQGFLAAWAATGFKTDKLVLGGVVGSAASLAYNLVLKPWLNKLSNVEGA